MKDDFLRRVAALDDIALALEGLREINEETIAAAGLPTAQEREAVRCAARAATIARKVIEPSLNEMTRACERLDEDMRAAATACTALDEPGTTLCDAPRLRTPGENLAEALADMSRREQH